MKVYEIKFERYELFALWNYEGIMFKSSDPKHPYPHQKGLWDKNTNSYPKGGPPWYDRVVIPSYLVRKEDYQEWVQLQLLPMAESVYLLDEPEYNIFFCKKEWKNGIEVGVAGIKGKGQRCNKKLSKKIEQLLKLKVFW